MKNIIAQGAEAIIIQKGNELLKDRIPKSYRITILDDKLRKQRTKKEIKLLEKAHSLNIPVPKVITSSDYQITMEKIQGEKLASSLDKLENKYEIAQQIGKTLAIIHDNNIIHGDLTTSNMIYNKKEDKVYFIDFGLGFESPKAEDKAVDLHVLKEALEARHFQHSNKLWLSVLAGYKTSKNVNQVLARLNAVEKRGRYKQAY